ncbi:putative biofilm stress and motility protein A [Raoultella terrigena]|nr:putative biofilm stress and motility protein A [Raoultella terrigena]
MNLKNSLLASALLATTALSAHAATELTPEQAAALKPYDRVVITGRFTAIGDAVKAVSRKADKDGAASFYVVDTSDYGNSGNWRVTADLYKDNAQQADAPKNRMINGIMELPKDQAVELEPFDTVTVQGFYRSQPEVNDAITKAAKAKGAVSFFIVRQVDANQGGNQRITAYVYKADAKKRVLQSPDAIPADSQAGRAALAEGGAAAKNVEIPGVATTAAVGSGTGVGRFFETQSSKGGRYTVTLPDGTQIEEVNKITAAQMAPFDSIKFTGNYGNMTEVSYQVAKRAAKKGAKYYHITRQWQERGGNMTISADLYK